MRAAGFLVMLVTIARCAGGSHDAPDAAATALPACLNGATPLHVRYAVSESSADLYLTVPEFDATGAYVVAHSASQHGTTIEFRWREKACVALRAELGEPGPTVGATYAIGTSATLALSDSDCGRTTDERTWRAERGTVVVKGRGADSLDLSAEARMVPDPKFPGTTGSFGLTADIGAGCFVELP